MSSLGISIERFELLMNSKIIPSINRIDGIQDLINLVKKYKIDKKKLIIGASSALVALGILEHNNDIDICVDPKYKEDLIKKGVIVIEEDHGHEKYMIKDSDIDCGIKDQEVISFSELQQMGTMEIDGFLFLSLEGLKKFYTILLEKLKEDYFQKKFKKRLELIEDFEKNNNY